MGWEDNRGRRKFTALWCSRLSIVRVVSKVQNVALYDRNWKILFIVTKRAGLPSATLSPPRGGVRGLGPRISSLCSPVAKVVRFKADWPLHWLTISVQATARRCAPRIVEIYPWWLLEEFQLIEQICVFTPIIDVVTAAFVRPLEKLMIPIDWGQKESHSCQHTCRLKHNRFRCIEWQLGISFTKFAKM